MEFNEMINNVLYTVITIVVPIIMTYAIKLIKAKIAESGIVKKLTENENNQNLILDAINNVLDAVKYVNQIYVDTLKNRGEFNEEAQKEAFNRAYVEAINMISDDSKKAIETIYGSFDKWLRLKIEASVNTAKNTKSNK